LVGGRETLRPEHLCSLQKTFDRYGFSHLEKKEKAIARHWIDDAHQTRLLSKYIVNDKHYGMWAIQIQDNKHEFHVITEEVRVFGSKLCTLEGPGFGF
jgi:hypothetical protein